MVLDRAHHVGLGLQAGLLAHRDRAAHGRDLGLELGFRPGQAPAAPLELAAALDHHVGPEAAHVEVRPRRELAHRVQAAHRDQVQRVGVHVGAHRGRVAGQLGQLVDREHREIRQLLVVGQVELAADLALGQEGGPKARLLGLRGQRAKLHPALDQIGQPVARLRIGGRELLTAGEGDHGLRGVARTGIRRRVVGVAGRALQQRREPARRAGGSALDLAHRPQPVGVQAALAHRHRADPLAAHRLDRVPPQLTDEQAVGAHQCLGMYAGSSSCSLKNETMVAA